MRRKYEEISFGCRIEAFDVYWIMVDYCTVSRWVEMEL